MKPLSLFFLLLILGGHAYSQTTISCDPYLIESRGKDYVWTINGLCFNAASGTTVIHPHYPAVDTIIFEDRKYRNTPDTIFTRITPGKPYRMYIGCCDAGFDIFADEPAQQYLLTGIPPSDDIMDSLYMASKQNGLVQIRIKNKPRGESLILMYGDLTGAGIGHLLTHKSSNWIKAHKVFYSNNDDFIVIARKRPGTPYTTEKDDRISWDGIPQDGIVPLKRISVRIFPHEKVTVDYDYETGDTRLSFQN